jgi:hypothetical protein
MTARAAYVEIFIVVAIIGALARAFLPPRIPVFAGGCALIFLSFFAWFGAYANDRVDAESGAVLVIIIMLLLPVLFIAWWLGWGIGTALKPNAYVARMTAPSGPTGMSGETRWDDSWLPIVVIAIIVAALVVLLPNAQSGWPGAHSPQKANIR